MSRRNANYQFLIAKIRPAVPEEQAAAADTLTMLLEHNMTSPARSRFGRSGDRLAHQAALRGKDLALACRMWFDAAQGEFNLLSTAFSQDGRLRGALEQAAREAIENKEALASGEAPPDESHHDLPVLTQAALALRQDWPPWLLALLELLCLTHRSWAYLRLYSARTSTQGWRSQLTALIWGPARHPSALTRHLTALALLICELNRVWAWRQREEAAADWVEEFLAALDTAARGDSLGEAGDDRRTWLARAASTLPNPLPHQSHYPELAQALGRLVELRAALGEAKVAAAWDEMSQQLAAPVVGGTLSEVVDALDALWLVEPPHPTERSPSLVLTDVLATAPPVPSTPASSASLPPQQVRRLLVQFLFAHTDPDSPEAFVLTRLTTAGASSFDHLRVGLRARFVPQGLAFPLLSGALTRLCGWHRAMTSLQEQMRSWNQGVTPPTSLELLDLPRTAADLAILTRAIDVVEAWTAGRTPCPGSWTPLPEKVILAVCGALLSACLDRLCVGMDQFFRQRRQGQQPGPSTSLQQSSAAVASHSEGP